MLRNHPSGVYVAFATNVGERFGFYIMMAILSLFLQAKFGLSVAETGDYYSWFYFGIYATALLGGIVADWMRKYKSVIFIGQIMMIAGYVLMALPFMSFYGSMIALLIIALGNGMFKGNLQVVVGQLYDDERYSKLRDSAFLFFYMGINIGAFFAPFIASGLRNWWLIQHGFLYDGSLAALCHQYLNNSLTDINQFQALIQKVSLQGQSALSLTEFSVSYIKVFTQGYHLAFGLAALAMVFSLIVYIIFNKTLPDKPAGQAAKQLFESFQVKQPLKQRKVKIAAVTLVIITILVFQLIPGLDVSGKLGLSFAVGLFMAFIAFIFMMAADDERPRVISLISLYVVVIFFWMSFNQNGLALTQFAVEYTAKEVSPFTFIFFDLKSILCVILAIVGVVLMLHSKSTLRYRFIGGVVTTLFLTICIYFMRESSEMNAISPEVFQSFNPLFVLLVMPPIIWLFNFLDNKGFEPSAPRKIAIGLIIAGLAFVILIVGSENLLSPNELQGSLVPESSRVSPYWLMSTYFVLTVAEIFLSPMGASFISKIAPKRFMGLMQGGWLFTTAVGSKFVVVGSFLWDKVELSVLWGIFAAACIASAVIVFLNVKKLEKSTHE